MTATPATAELRERAAAHEQWYHTLELAPGLVTPGWFDLREVPDRIPFPDDLRGQRCLDVATFDGFWAYTMEARGAEDVQAIDLLQDDSWDWPIGAAPAAVSALSDRKNAGEGFLIAREALGSRVERHEQSIYDLHPDRNGTFDFVYVGSLLLHLRDPIAGLQAARSVCRGRLLLLDAIHLPLTLRHPRAPVATFDGVGRPWWWKPNRAALLRMVESAGFRVLEHSRPVLLPPGGGQPPLRPRRLPRALRHPEGRTIAFRTQFGDPHLAILAEPA